MKKAQPYRVQLHCNKYMHAQIKEFAQERGLSVSGAARVLIDRAIAARNDELNERIDELQRVLQLILHAASASRVFASEAAIASGSTVSSEELKERILKLVERYNNYEG